MSEQEYEKQQQSNNIPSGSSSSTKMGAHGNGSTSKETDVDADKSESDKEGKPQSNPSPSHDPIIKCLKVSPTLFTPEKLNQFDTVALYTTLINCSQHTEQGERLNNLSWRIVNKAMVKNKSINSSKKRDGVKNLYYVLNSVNQSLIPGKPNETNNNNNNTTTNTSISHSQPAQQVHPTVLRTSATTTNLPSATRKSALKTTYKSFNGLFPLVSQRFQHQNSKTNNDNLTNDNINNNDNDHMHTNEKNSINHPIVVTGFDTNTLITKTKIKSKSISRSSSRSSTRSLSNDNAKSKESRNNSKNKINSKNSSTDTSTADMKSKYSKYNNNINNNLHLPQPNKDSLFVSSSSKYNNGNSRDASTKKKNSNKIFFSSEEEEEEDSEWNSLSSDDDDYVYDDYSDDDEDDEEEEEEEEGRLDKNRSRRPLADTFSNEDDEEEDDDDQYYKRQWNKLVFTKQSKLKATISPPESMSSSLEKTNGRLTTSNSHEQIIRKSLLSGLFSNEKHSNTSSKTAPPHPKTAKPSSQHIPTSIETASSAISSKANNYHHHHPLPATGNIAHANTDIITTTSTVTAHGSVTAAKDPMNAIAPLEEMIQRERRGRQMNRPLTATNSRKMSRQSSYNSLFSDDDEIGVDLHNNNNNNNDVNGNTAEIERGRKNEKSKGASTHRDLHQDTRSNAPLTAQTILPTALSTHMFLPNSIIQQRKASGNDSGGLPQATRPTPIQRRQAEPTIVRRDSIDIPTKNRSQLLLKTRMEISEEERRARRKRQGNVN